MFAVFYIYSSIRA